MPGSTDLAPSPLPNPAEWNGYSTAPCAAVGLGLAVIAVALRFWARAGIVRVTGMEDWFILVALAFSVAITACVGLRTFHPPPSIDNSPSASLGARRSQIFFGRTTPWIGEARGICES